MIYDSKSLRIVLEKEELLNLSIKTVTQEKLFKVEETWEYNPTHYYPKGIRLKKNERGHDLKYRYILI